MNGIFFKFFKILKNKEMRNSCEAQQISKLLTVWLKSYCSLCSFVTWIGIQGKNKKLNPEIGNR